MLAAVQSGQSGSVDEAGDNYSGGCDDDYSRESPPHALSSFFLRQPTPSYT